MLNDKKRISLTVLVLIVFVVFVIGSVSMVVLMNKDNSKNKSDTKLDESKPEESKPVEKIENELVPGAEYYAPERDIDGVTSKKFSFFIGNDRKILTYINEDEQSKIKISSHNFRENSVSVVFNFNDIDVVVSDNNYHRDGESINYTNKQLVAEENGIKYYTAPYKKGFNVHYFETVVDGMPVSFYALVKGTKNDSLFTGIQNLASKLSVNDKVGLWADWELSKNYARNGIALKSSKLFSWLPVSSSYSQDKIMIGGYELSVLFSIYSWRDTSVHTPNVVMGEIAGQKYGYYTTKDDSGNTNVRVHIYESKMLGDKEVYTNSPTIFFFEKLNETNLTAEQFATMVMEQVIEFKE